MPMSEEEMVIPLRVRKIGNSLFFHLTKEFRKLFNPQPGDIFIVKIVKIVRNEEIQQKLEG